MGSEMCIRDRALGLAWTSAGGELLHVQVSILPGKGKAKFTGRLGDVMTESVQTAISVALRQADSLGFDSNILNDHNVHIHFPEAAVPKDGPSAGVAIVSALVSSLSQNPLPNDIAFTGEITLTGRILPVGGLPEKLLAAKRYNIKKVLIPEGNKKDLPEVKDEVMEGVKIIPVSSINEVFDILFEK